MVCGLKWPANADLLKGRYPSKKGRAGQGQKQGKVLNA